MASNKRKRASQITALVIAGVMLFSVAAAAILSYVW